MASRKKGRSTKWVEVPLDAPNEPWWKEVGGFEPLEGHTFAANADFVKLVLMTIDPSGTPRTLSVPELHNRPMRLKYLPEWPLLAVFHDESLELLDVSDPTSPRRRQLFEYEVGHERAIASIDQDLYVTHKNGVAWLNPQTKKPEHLFDVPEDRYFDSYPTALAAIGGFLYVVGRHAGLHVYQRTAQTEFTLIRSHKKGYAPTSSLLWSPGVLLLTGNEDVIPVDVRVPAKAALQKSCKVPKLDIESPLCRLSATTAFVAGPSLRTADLNAVTVDLTEPLKPVVSERELIGDPSLDWHSSRAIRVGDFIIAGSVYLDRTHVFRRA